MDATGETNAQAAALAAAVGSINSTGSGNTLQQSLQVQQPSLVQLLSRACATAVPVEEDGNQHGVNLNDIVSEAAERALQFAG
ncbi:expressed unknown protein [Seminavis robusta]|uniref:Uncharacterized protein n=1 Tax=Seminavis robusta TaxID=568900 RepID=A0A9N8DTW3_9STRA|nr:expressed unknown protein [Seminavis robusta]|eukprot:Sro275_g105720.1 n/a (83) ;mRNA; r:40827-41075